MHPRTIRSLDVWIGQPVCWLLSVWRWLLKVVIGEPLPERPPRSICFIKMTEQGASVLAHAAVRRAIEICGRENVYFWVFEENRPILDVMGQVPKENVLAVDSTSLGSFIKSTLATLKIIRQKKIEATVDMEFFARASAILGYLTGAKRRVGLHRFTYETPFRGNLLTHRVIYNPYLHTSLHYLTLVDALLSDRRITPLPKFTVPGVLEAPPAYEPPAADVTKVRTLLGELLPMHSQLVLLNPNASDMLPLRRWDGGNFIELAKRLVARPGVAVGLTGGRFERQAVENMAREVGSDRCVSLAGRTSLRELFALYHEADILVTNDSGPGHFASLTPIKAVVLFGPETPLLYGPLGENIHVVWAGLACSPCVSALNHRFSPCDNNVCMQSIDVGHVEGVISSLLAGEMPASSPHRSPVPRVSLPVASTRPDVAT